MTTAAQMPWRLAGALVLSAGCVQSHYNLASRHQDYSLTSTEREIELGRKLARRVSEELTLADDATLQQRMGAIGTRIAAVCDRRELTYHFAALDDDKEVNAFSLPGGYVFVYTGLIERTATDDELAAVIAHEVAHVAARHAVKRYEGGLGLQIAQLAALASRHPQAAHGISAAGGAAQLAYARQDELEADRLAVAYMRSAGFDPNGMFTFLETLREIHREQVQYLPRGVVRPSYALTHPYIPERLLAVKEALFGVADYIDYLNAPAR